MLTRERETGERPNSLRYLWHQLKDFIKLLAARAETFAGLERGAIRHVLFTEYETGRRHWMASRQGRVRCRAWNLARLGLSLPVSPKDLREVAALHVRCRTVFGLSHDRQGQVPLGAQHPARRCVAMVHHLSHDGAVIDVSHRDLPRLSEGKCSRTTRDTCRVRYVQCTARPDEGTEAKGPLVMSDTGQTHKLFRTTVRSPQRLGGLHGHQKK